MLCLEVGHSFVLEVVQERLLAGRVVLRVGHRELRARFRCRAKGRGWICVSMGSSSIVRAAASPYVPSTTRLTSQHEPLDTARREDRQSLPVS